MVQSFYKLKIPKDVVTLLRGMHPDIKKKIKLALQTILTMPNSGKELKEELKGLRSYRVSKFRIIYKISSAKHIDIVAVGPRVSIYEETYRIIRSTKLYSE